MITYIPIVIKSNITGEDCVNLCDKEEANRLVNDNKAKYYSPVANKKTIKLQKPKNDEIYYFKFEVINYKFAKDNNLVIGQTYCYVTRDWLHDKEFNKLINYYQVAAIKGYINSVPLEDNCEWFEPFQGLVEKDKNNEYIMFKLKQLEERLRTKNEYRLKLMREKEEKKRSVKENGREYNK